MPEPDAPPTPPPSTQYEMMRDAGFKHLEHIEDDDTRATQRIQSRPTLIGDNHAALNAIIESITCYNFMCHERLHCDLGPLLNFIVGENGSGKSAILTAITLCLGGKASATNRGGSLRSFVKEGRDHASLVVKIKNQGTDAYKPDQFGESIIVERWFTKSGSSGFKLKSETGRIISTKKGDVDDVVDYFCLQVDNPLNVLSQDNARQFLNAASSATKYKYFVQGTQLEQLSNDYQLLQEYLDANEAKLYEFQETIDILKQKSEKAVKQRDAVTKNVEMRQKRDLIRTQLIWSQVEQQEQLLKEKEDIVAAAQQEIEQTQELVNRQTEELEKVDRLVQEAHEDLERIKAEEGDIQEAEEDARAKFNEAKKKLVDIRAQERDIHGQVQNAATKVREHEAKIRDEEQRLEDANGGLLAEKQKELDEARQAKKDIDDAIATHNAGAPHPKQQLERAKKESERAGQLVQQKSNELDAAEQVLKNLKGNRMDPFAGYDPKIQQLLKAIENDGGFSQKPIGPIGSLIQLTKPQWSAILENVLNAQLSGFIVTSRPDQQRLQSLINRLQMRSSPTIYIAPRTSLGDLREPDRNFSTVLRVLKIETPIVRDQLVIQANIEQLLLVDEREEAQDIMLGERAPPNVAACITHLGDGPSGLRITNKNGGLASSPFTPTQNHKHYPRMKSNIESRINFQSGLVERLTVECNDLENSKKDIDEEVRRWQTEVGEYGEKTKVLEKKSTDAQVRIDQIEVALDAFDGVDGRLQSLKEDLADYQRQKDHYGNQFGDLTIQRKEFNKEVESLKQEYDNAKTVTQEFKTKIAKAEDKIKRREGSRRVILVEKNQAHETHELAKANKTKAEVSRDEQVALVEEYTRKATEAHPERVFIPEGETYDTLERKYISLREQLQKIRHQLGASDEEIHERAARAIEEYREQKKHHKNLDSLVDGLKQALNTRLEKWRYFQRLISAHARVNFAYLLSERQFRGKLLLDHKARKLEIQVEPDGTRKNESGRNTKTLSGGEKSFSSICLLLAIWDAIGSPLRCLDEFDVFMDNVNRKISTNMLVSLHPHTTKRFV